MSDGVAAAQLPGAGELSVDHVAHFVPDMDAASAALERLGFAPTPFSPQSHRLQPDGPLEPAGTANRCVMLERGYLEFLTPTGDTPLADQLRSAISRYVGVHLIAFGTADAAADYARLTEEGFEPLAPLALQRPISTANAEGTARFAVVRVPPAAMPEGRIQYCQQLTPELLWQPRWLEHANGATALASVFVCVADPGRVAHRYSRYTGIAATRTGATWTLATARGSLLFAGPETVRDAFGVAAPAVPWVAGYALESADMARTREFLIRAGLEVREHGDGGIAAALPQALGGIVLFVPAGGPARL